MYWNDCRSIARRQSCLAGSCLAFDIVGCLDIAIVLRHRRIQMASGIDSNPGADCDERSCSNGTENRRTFCSQTQPQRRQPTVAPGFISAKANCPEQYQRTCSQSTKRSQTTRRQRCYTQTCFTTSSVIGFSFFLVGIGKSSLATGKLVLFGSLLRGMVGDSDGCRWCTEYKQNGANGMVKRN